MKKFNYIPIYILMLTAAFCFTACSDDDDEGSGAPKKENSFITADNGDKLLLTNNGKSSFTYNSEGLLTKLSGRYNSLNISYNPCTFNSESGDLENYSFKLNGAGYVGEASGTYEDNGNGFYEKGSERVSYSYDSKGHLTRISASSSYYGTDEGERFSGSSRYTSIFTWNNDNLTKVVTNYEYAEDGEKESGTDTYTLTYGDNAHENRLGQFSHSIAEAYIDVVEDYYEICFSGFFGKPSKYFPTKVECYDEEGYRDFSINAIYTFNNNGTLAREYHNSTTSYYHYSYSNAPTATQNAKAMPAFASGKSIKSHKLLRSHRKK